MLHRNKKRRFLVWLGIFVFLFIAKNHFTFAYTTQNQYDDYTDLDLIRFHIRAESNQTIHQQEKMAVREAVLRYMDQKISKVSDKLQMRRQILEHRQDLEQTIQNTLKSYGADPGVAIYFTKEFFPMRKYGQTIVPAGIYEAMRIDLGKAKGKNWWCILYPSFCLIDSNHVLENPKDKEKLEAMFEGEQVKVKYKSYLKELVEKHWKDKK